MSTPASRRSLVCLSARTTIRSASTLSTIPSRLPTTVTPESRPTVPSRPVPTRGASGFSRGTAWRCMFEPISAVRVVVLEERDERGGDRHELVGRHVHVLDVFGADYGGLAADTRRHQVRSEAAVRVELRIGLRDYL